MTIELKDELELTGLHKKVENEEEVSEIIKLFQFSNLNLIVSNPKGEIIFASNAFCNLSGFFVKELVKKSLDQIFNQKFDTSEILEIERETECFSAMRVLRTRNEKEIRVNTYNTFLREFLNTYIVTILVPSPIM